MVYIGIVEGAFGYNKTQYKLILLSNNKELLTKQMKNNYNYDAISSKGTVHKSDIKLYAEGSVEQAKDEILVALKSANYKVIDACWLFGNGVLSNDIEADNIYKITVKAGRR